MTRNNIDGGEAVLEAFRSLGFDFIFSSPGSEWAPVWEALARRDRDGRSGPVYLDLWHETLAVAMAIGYTLVTGRPQAVLLHAAPGLLQGTCGIHGALLANVPMVVCSSESITYGERPESDPGSQWYRNLSIVGGPHTLVQPIVKWANQAGSVEVVYEMLRRAGEIAQRSPAGPVYVNVPVESLLTAWTPPKTVARVAPPARKVSPASEIAELANMLAAARKPVILTESTGRDPNGFHALVALADQLAIPVVETQGSICANFPANHPMHQGGDLKPFRDADLVLLVNCRAPWYPPSNKPDSAKTVVIDEVPQRPHMVYQVLNADLYLEGEVTATLEGAVQEVRRIGFDTASVDSRRARWTAAHDALQAARVDAETKAKAASGLTQPVRLATRLREVLGSEAVFVDETITHSQVLQRHLQWEKPSGYYYVQGGLGQGFGVALGAKLALRERLVVLCIGDGSFLYNPVIPGLGASRDLDLPILVVVFNNKKYLSMKGNLLRSYPDGVSVERDKFYGSDLSTQPDLAEFVRPFGMHGETVLDSARLDRALDDAIAAVRGGTTAVLNVLLSR